jgi:hypothetical protein
MCDVLCDVMIVEDEGRAVEEERDERTRCVFIRGGMVAASRGADRGQRGICL